MKAYRVVSSTVSKSVAKCLQCDWSRTAKSGGDLKGLNEEIRDHVSARGHEVDRDYRSKTAYRPTDETVEIEEPAPERQMWCRQCAKRIGINAKNRVLFWAAGSHHRKTGHTVELVEPDGTRSIYRGNA